MPIKKIVMKAPFENNNSIKIAYIIGNMASGGVPSFALNYLKNLDKNRFIVDFYVYEPSENDSLITSYGGRVFYMPKIKNLIKFLSYLKKSFVINQYDIVHAHMTTLSVFPLYAAKKAKIKVRICHAHSTTDKKDPTRVIKNILRPFSSLYATDIAGCSDLSNSWLYGKKRSRHAKLIKNAINIDQFANAMVDIKSIKANLGISDKKVFGHIGRLENQKNTLFLLKIFKLISMQVDNVVLVIVGDGSLRPKIKRFIGKYEIADKVLLLPETRDVYKYYHIFDIFLLPSLYEGLPLVAIEAQAAAIPCILSNKITKEVNVSGFIQYLPINDAYVWADKAIEVLNNPSKYDAIDSLKSSGYEITSAAKDLSQYYEDLVKRGNHD